MSKVDKDGVFPHNPALLRNNGRGRAHPAPPFPYLPTLSVFLSPPFPPLSFVYIAILLCIYCVNNQK